MSDQEVLNFVEIDITVDKVKNMKNKGQYIYVHVTNEPINDGCENIENCIIKFNDGHFGGSHDDIFNNPLIQERQKRYRNEPWEVAMYWTNVKPAIMKLLQ